MPLEFSGMRQTVFDLYIERDRLPWFFRVLATLSTWLVPAGFLLFPVAFTSEINNLKASRSALVTIAVIFLVFGYATVTVLALLSKSLLFNIDVIFVPMIVASTVGLAAVVFNHSLHDTIPAPHLYIVIPLVIASVSTVVFVVITATAFNRFRIIKGSDNRRRMRITRDRMARGSQGDITSTTELLPQNLPEDELQRQQLLRLLLKRDVDRAPSPDSGNTYRIDLPSPDFGNSSTANYLSVPTTPNIPSRLRSDSLPGTQTRFQLANLLRRTRSPTVDSFKDPRERRREEIERGAAAGVLTEPRRNVPVARGGLAEGWPSPPPVQQQAPPTPRGSRGWSGTPPTSRYS